MVTMIASDAADWLAGALSALALAVVALGIALARIHGRVSRLEAFRENNHART